MAPSTNIKQIYFLLSTLLLVIILPTKLSGQEKISFEILPGGAITFPSSLTIHQEGYDDLKIIAHYRTENFIFPIYYSYRLSFPLTNKFKGEIELNHLKIILDNPTNEISEFQVSHGYNQIWLNLAGNLKGFIYHAGFGGVLGHPENTIRGNKYNEKLGLFNRGYYLCGVTSQLSLQKKINIGNHFYISAETKLNMAYARIPIMNGYAQTPVYALHFLTGAGIKF